MCTWNPLCHLGFVLMSWYKETCKFQFRLKFNSFDTHTFLFFPTQWGVYYFSSTLVRLSRIKETGNWMMYLLHMFFRELIKPWTDFVLPLLWKIMFIRILLPTVHIYVKNFYVTYHDWGFLLLSLKGFLMRCNAHLWLIKSSIYLQMCWIIQMEILYKRSFL